ncbi:selT-like protein [Phoenix dactylifera]|uniref:SelT-like protein n=1 Tax=Phoenix dactylifera TaxID=42345 RepID=A0A8B7CS89_PHODC|nr:selT-like protein [Phoenix dactylifera]
MDRVQLLLLGFPVFLFCSDLVNLFTPPPPKQHHHHHHPPPPSIHETTDFSATQSNHARGVYYGSVVELKFCVSCSYRGNAMTMKKMLETSFPGIEVILSNYPPALPKRLLSKVVPIVQVGAIAAVVAGDQIFPRLGITPPPWYFNLRANRFGAIATTWLLGNFAQSTLQSTGAFEVFCNGDLVFSKLQEHRFPGELELKDLIANRLPNSALGKNLGSVWS